MRDLADIPTSPTPPFPGLAAQLNALEPGASSVWTAGIVTEVPQTQSNGPVPVSITGRGLDIEGHPMHRDMEALQLARTTRRRWSVDHRGGGFTVSPSLSPPSDSSAALLARSQPAMPRPLRA